MSGYTFLDPAVTYPLPHCFNFREYIETENEFWAFFPETQGRRVNYCQLGLTAQIYVESQAEGDLQADETYFLLPCEDRMLRAVRMRALRRLTLDEYRLSHMTALRMLEHMAPAAQLMNEIHLRILGPEILGVLED